MTTKRHFFLALATLVAAPFTAKQTAGPAAASPAGQDEMIAKLATRVQHLEDMQGIQKLQAKYLHYLFTQRFDKVFADCFAQDRDDVSVEFSDSGVYRGHDHVKELYAAFNATRDLTGFFIMHMTTNPFIEIASDGMSAKSHWLSPGITSNGERAGWVFGPYYVDYVKEGGEWRILHTNLAPIVRTSFERSWAKAENNGTVRVLDTEPDAPSTLYRPFAEVKHEKDIFRNHPDLPEPY